MNKDNNQFSETTPSVKATSMNEVGSLGKMGKALGWSTLSESSRSKNIQKPKLDPEAVPHIESVGKPHVMKLNPKESWVHKKDKKEDIKQRAAEKDKNAAETIAHKRQSRFNPVTVKKIDSSK